VLVGTPKKIAVLFRAGLGGAAGAGATAGAVHALVRVIDHSLLDDRVRLTHPRLGKVDSVEVDPFEHRFVIV